MNSPIVVVGAGVIGLTTSVRLLQAGFPVLLVASHFPTDPLTPTYASSAAGAHHLSFAADDDERQQRLDKRTFDVMWEEEEREGDKSGLMRLEQVEYYGEGADKHIQFFEQLPDFKVLDKSNLPPTIHHGVSFTSLTMDVPVYLPKLFNKFKSFPNAQLLRTTLSSLSSALTLTSIRPQAVINCTGLGARLLSDYPVKMTPVRGHVLLLKAPWITQGRTRQIGSMEGAESGERTYIIPRRSGDVIVGGTREEGDWSEVPRKETSRDIKRRALEIYPELVPLHKRSDKPKPEDLDEIVIKEVIGFRPARVEGSGGLLLERGKDLDGNIVVVHNLGHSGAGWQCSWGCAEEVVKIVKKSLGNISKL